MKRYIKTSHIEDTFSKYSILNEGEEYYVVDSIDLDIIAGPFDNKSEAREELNDLLRSSKESSNEEINQITIRQMASSIKKPRSIEPKKQENYIYQGPAYHFDEEIDYGKQIKTTAVSKKEAISNIKYRIAKRQGYHIKDYKVEIDEDKVRKV